MLKNIPIRLQKHILNDLHVVIVGEPRRYPGEGPADPGSPFFWDQTEAPRAEKKLFLRPSLPYLKLWIRHWYLSFFLAAQPLNQARRTKKRKKLAHGLINGKYNKINFWMYWHVPKSVDTIHLQNQLWTRRKKVLFLLLSLKTVRRSLENWLIIGSKKNKRICDIYFYQQLKWPKSVTKFRRMNPRNLT